ncbi:MAG: hypothetical protein JJU13_00045 [Balneolaceae bacterium]|nr:hypothetical protein [Balneolaceae bacterium]
MENDLNGMTGEIPDHHWRVPSLPGLRNLMFPFHTELKHGAMFVRPIRDFYSETYCQR